MALMRFSSNDARSMPNNPPAIKHNSQPRGTHMLLKSSRALLTDKVSHWRDVQVRPLGHRSKSIGVNRKITESSHLVRVTLRRLTKSWRCYPEVANDMKRWAMTRKEWRAVRDLTCIQPDQYLQYLQQSYHKQILRDLSILCLSAPNPHWVPWTWRKSLSTGGIHGTTTYMSVCHNMKFTEPVPKLCAWGAGAE